jgi:hypothetical protein
MLGTVSVWMGGSQNVVTSLPLVQYLFSAEHVSCP